MDTTMTTTEAPPETDDRDPAGLIPEAVDEVLALAATWLAWDGRPRHREENVWTPHKALRRVTDHLLDHLAEVHALLAGEPTVPDTWHGRSLTLDSDWARFTEADLDEARNRLLRLAATWRALLGRLPAGELDKARADAWTIRQIVHHVANVTWYARQLGPLS